LKNIFVGNLSFSSTEDGVRAIFEAHGTVDRVSIITDRETGKSRGFAFVEFNDSTEAQEAIRLFNSQPFKGRPLAVNEARAKEARPAGPGGPGGFRPSGPRPAPTGGFRPSGPGGGGFRPSGPGGSGGGRDFGPPDSGAMDMGRGDKVNRKFGPDAKPFKNRSPKAFRPEGAKRTFKEKGSGQLYSMDDEGDLYNEPEIDNFAEGVDEDSSDA